MVLVFFALNILYFFSKGNNSKPNDVRVGVISLHLEHHRSGINSLKIGLGEVLEITAVVLSKSERAKKSIVEQKSPGGTCKRQAVCLD